MLLLAINVAELSDMVLFCDLLQHNAQFYSAAVFYNFLSVQRYSIVSGFDAVMPTF
jgi:hypothetical protein